MEVGHKKTVWDYLKKYDPSVNEHDFIEITEWTNGEGVDILISKNSDKLFSMTYDELEAIKYLTMILRYEKVKEK